MNLLKAKRPPNNKGNLTKQERLGLTELANDPNIVIKKADKGSAVVVIQTIDYLHEGYRQLSDKEFYTKLKEDPTMDISKRICNVLTEMKNLKIMNEKTLTLINPKLVDFTYCPRYIKRTSQADLYAVQLDTPHVILVNLWMHT